MRVTNIGPDPYVGPIVVNDKLLAPPAGAVMTFANVPPWLCFGDYTRPSTNAAYGPTVLLPGDSVDLYVTVDFPAAPPVCYVDNLARHRLVVAVSATPIPPTTSISRRPRSPDCLPPADEKTNLKI